MVADMHTSWQRGACRAWGLEPLPEAAAAAALLRLASALALAAAAAKRSLVSISSRQMPLWQCADGADGATPVISNEQGRTMRCQSGRSPRTTHVHTRVCVCLSVAGPLHSLVSPCGLWHCPRHPPRTH